MNKFMKSFLWTIGIIIGLFVIIFIVGIIAGVIIGLNSSNEPEQQSNPHIITKSTFKGTWAFTTDVVQVYNIPLANNSSLTGGKVIIDGNAYAVTRDLTNLEFLPDKYWKDAPSHIYEPTGEKVCDGDSILIDDKCKMSLSDIVSYIDKLPVEK